MKTVAWTALLALIVSLPFFLRRRSPASVRTSQTSRDSNDKLYENEDFFA